MAWVPKYDRLKRASNKAKKEIWNGIWEAYKKELDEDPKDLHQVKNKIKNVESDYRNAKERISRTGEEGVRRIISSTLFFYEIDEFLGHRDAIDPANMLVISSFAKEKVSDEVVPERTRSPWTKRAGKRKNT